jgi:glycosyltransferase involved in cell wall biosynthesis
MIPVYILIRTSGRPRFFNRMMQSIKEQTYPNIITIVHTDNDRDKYVKGDIIVRGTPKPGCRAPYNLYMNTLIKTVSRQTPGWVYMLDDDDRLFAPDVIERFVNAAKQDYINVARADRGHGRIWPKKWKRQTDFQTECFMLWSKYSKLGKWWGKTGGDHHYTKQITKILPINWVDDLIVAKAQDGKNRGKHRDLGDPK